MSCEERERDVLSERIKEHHKTMREKYMKTGDAVKVWRENCDDVETLQQYAADMRLLAERHWERTFSSNPVYSRISWCIEACNYYFKEGGLQKAVDKDARTEYFLKHGTTSDADIGKPPKRQLVDAEEDMLVLDVGSCYNPFSRVPGWTVVAFDIAPASPSVFRADFLSLELKDTDYLSEFRKLISSSATLREASSSGESIQITAAIPTKSSKEITKEFEETQTSSAKVILKEESIENKEASSNDGNLKYPAVEGASKAVVSENGTYNQKEITLKKKEPYETDISIVKGQIAGSCSATQVHTSPNITEVSHRVLEWLPKGSFRIVILCLVLGYMPCPAMRFQCCKQAYDVLKYNGVLVIITPDSKHVGANAVLMKEWRQTLGWLGFTRVRYDKLPHLHCMLFRKVPNPRLAHREAERLVMKAHKTDTMPSDYIKPHKLFIHQDNDTMET